MDFHSLVHNPIGTRGGAGQYCLINVVTTVSGGTGSTNTQASILPSQAGTNQLVSVPRQTQILGGNSARIDYGVALPMPINPGVNYGADYKQDQTGLTERALGAGVDLIKGKESLQDFAKRIGANIGPELFNQATKLAYSTAFRSAARNAGYAWNPHMELFYSGPTFRVFPLEWQFSFVKKTDADTFDKIVEKLAYYAHPDFLESAQNSGVWKIPDSFLIEYVNAKTRKIGACVLTSLNVNYANSGGGWRGFQDGNPAHVSLALTFLEISPRTKQDILAGM